MRLIVHDMFVEAKGDSDEMREIRKIMHIKNPRATFGGNRVNQKQPEYIDFIDDDGRFLRGLMPWVHEELVRKRVATSYEIVTDDYGERTFVHCPPTILPGVTPRDYQLTSAEQAYNHRRGIIQVATGGGKTVVIALHNSMIERFEDGITLTMVNKKHLLHQTVAKFAEYGLKNVGMIGDGVFDPNRHTVAMVQSLYAALRRGDETFSSGVTSIAWDETHHLGAVSWGGIAYSVPSKWSIGFSGTPFREGFANAVDPADMQMQGITGPVLVKITASQLIERGLLAKPHIFMIPVVPAHCEDARTPAQKKEADEASTWNQVECVWISGNPHRNQLITRLAKVLVARGLNPLVLVQKLAHGKELVRLLTEIGLRPIFLSGGPKRHLFDESEPESIRTEDSPDADADVAAYLRGDYNVLIGSTVFDEGVDLPAVTALINCAGGKSFVRNLQRVGRGLRPKPGTNEAYIFDFIDHGSDWTERHSYERLGDYASEPAYSIYEGYKPTVEFFGEQW